jgi:hypothetical protein
MNGRRSFVKGISLFGALGAGYATAFLQDRNAEMAGPNISDADSNTVVEDISHLAPLGTVNLVLTANNEPPPPPPPPTTFGNEYILTTGSSYITSPVLSISGASTPNQNNVKMSVGKDDRLWIEVDGKWRRVALDA